VAFHRLTARDARALRPSQRGVNVIATQRRSMTVPK
jgi:hypothetical protein